MWRVSGRSIAIWWSLCLMFIHLPGKGTGFPFIDALNYAGFEDTENLGRAQIKGIDISLMVKLVLLAYHYLWGILTLTLLIRIILQPMTL